MVVKLLKTKKSIFVSGIVFVGIALLVGGICLWQYNLNNAKQASETATKDDVPPYTTILPTGKSIESLGGWKRLSPPDTKPSYVYVDSIGGVSIQVNEQRIPDSFKDRLDTSVASLAKGFNATDTVDAGGTTVYIGTNAKGPQSVIFTKKGLLILIKSQQKIDNSLWKDYVQALN